MRENYQEKVEKEFEERVVQIDRITRVVKGGRRMRFRAIVVLGDKNGRVGVGVDKSAEVVGAIEKATAKAKRNMVKVNLTETSIPHEVTSEFAGAKVFLKPARKGTGVIAGGAVRAVLEVAGVKDILSKIQGSSSKLNNVYATIKGLEKLVMIEKKAEEATKPKAKAKAKTAPKTVKKAVKKPKTTEAKGEK